MARSPGQASLFGGIEPPKAYAPKFVSEKANGYAARPGSGPEGETCGSCCHCRVRGGHAKNFYKCGLMLGSWTSGRGSDVLLKSPACKHHEPGTPSASTARVRHYGED